MRGPKTKPTVLKLAQGTARPGRLNPREPTPSADAPAVSQLLAPAARPWYETLCARLEAEKRLTASHEEIIATAANRCAEIVACHAILAKDGMYYESVSDKGTVMKRSHPVLAQLNEAERHLHSLLAELGLSPASMAKVSALGGDGDENPFRENDSRV